MFRRCPSISGTPFVRYLGVKAGVTEKFVRVSRLLQPSSFSKQDGKQAPQCRSQKLMLDNGLIMPGGTGTFVLLPLAAASLNRLTDLIDTELKRVGGQKVNLPCLVPGTLLKTTGRWEKLGSELFQLQDRRDHDYCLGPVSVPVVFCPICSGLLWKHHSDIHRCTNKLLQAMYGCIFLGIYTLRDKTCR